MMKIHDRESQTLFSPPTCAHLHISAGDGGGEMNLEPNLTSLRANTV